MTSELHGELYSVYYNTFIKFTKNRNLFNDTYSVLIPYINKDDISFMYNDINNIFKNMLDTNLDSFFYEGSPGYLENENIRWNRTDAIPAVNFNSEEGYYEDEPINLEEKYGTDVLDDFEEKFTSFCLNLDWLFDSPLFINQGNINPFSINKIQKTQAYGQEITNIRIIRNDGKSFTLQLDNSDIGFVIDSLEKIKEA